MYNKIISGFLQVTRKHFWVIGQSLVGSGGAEVSFTISTRIKVDNVPNTNVDDTEEALVLLLELLLVKDLYCEHAVFRNAPARYVSLFASNMLTGSVLAHMSKLSFQ